MATYVDFGIDFDGCPTTGPANALRQRSRHMAAAAATGRTVMLKGGNTTERRTLEYRVKGMARHAQNLGADAVANAGSIFDDGSTWGDKLFQAENQLRHNLAERAYLDAIGRAAR